MRIRKTMVITIVVLFYIIYQLYLLSLSFRRSKDPKKEPEKNQPVDMEGQALEVNEPFTPFINLISKNFTQAVQNQEFFHPLKPAFPLTGSLSSPMPKFLMGNLSTNLDIIIGITTVKRENGDYLRDTLKSLLANVGSHAYKMAYVVYIGETLEENVIYIASQLYSSFPSEIRSGKIQIISPPQNYYPPWDEVLITNFGDTIERVKWRSKQNLDQIFLMMYIYQYSPQYYLMMEDDVVAATNYLDKIWDEIKKHENDEWFFLSFCNLGAIGKLFRCSTIPSYASFIDMFWNKKPLDWLQDDFVSSAYCNLDEDQKHCNQRKKEQMIFVKPSLFQHVGKFSSLNGKIQNRQDKYFRKD